MDTTRVASAMRIGAALGSAADVEWDEVFAGLRQAVPLMCAVQVTGWDPVARRFVIMGEHGYHRDISQELAHELPRTKWGGQLFDSPVPLLMDDMPHNFRDSPHYQEQLRPAGFEDGLSATLKLGPRQVVGVLHLNAPERSAFDEETRRFVAEVGTFLARRVDPLHHPRLDAWFGPEWTASWVLPVRAPVTGRSPAPLAHDPELRALAERFAALGVRTVPFLWPAKDGWHRVRLVRVADGPRGGGVIAACTAFENTPGLTARELDIATGLVAGLSNQAIAEALVVSRRTVETYVERLLTKLDCQSRGEAAGVAARAGFIRPSPAGLGDLARLTRGADSHWG